jgi:hypothetical protein
MSELQSDEEEPNESTRLMAGQVTHAKLEENGDLSVSLLVKHEIWYHSIIHLFILY